MLILPIAAAGAGAGAAIGAIGAGVARKKKKEKDKKKVLDHIVFGQDPNVVKLKTPTGLPIIVEEIARSIEVLDGIKRPEIFIKDGNAQRIDDLADWFDSAKDIDLTIEDIYVISGLLKKYLDEMPEPLFTIGLVLSFQHLGAEIDSKPKEAFLAESRELISQLPHGSLAVLRRLMEIWKGVVDNYPPADKEKNEQALVEALAPLLLRYDPDHRPSKLVLHRLTKDQKKQLKSTSSTVLKVEQVGPNPSAPPPSALAAGGSPAGSSAGAGEGGMAYLNNMQLRNSCAVLKALIAHQAELFEPLPRLGQNIRTKTAYNAKPHKTIRKKEKDGKPAPTKGKPAAAPASPSAPSPSAPSPSAPPAAAAAAGAGAAAVAASVAGQESSGSPSAPPAFAVPHQPVGSPYGLPYGTPQLAGSGVAPYGFPVSPYGAPPGFAGQPGGYGMPPSAPYGAPAFSPYGASMGSPYGAPAGAPYGYPPAVGGGGGGGGAPGGVPGGASGVQVLQEPMSFMTPSGQVLYVYPPPSASLGAAPPLAHAPSQDTLYPSLEQQQLQEQQRLSGSFASLPSSAPSMQIPQLAHSGSAGEGGAAAGALGGSGVLDAQAREAARRSAAVMLDAEEHQQSMSTNTLRGLASLAADLDPSNLNLSQEGSDSGEE